MQGSGGGPLEFNTTAFLVRSVAQEWRKGSLIAVDAGVHLSAIARILTDTQPANPESIPFTLTKGPFAGLSLPHRRPEANALHVMSLVDTYMITHPHLDHISGFVINTAAPPGTRPKKVAGLPATIQALKTHIFNNVVWPNLSDENNGAGLVTYLRLVEGGSPALGDGEGKGYSEVCEGLLVKTWSVSHGHCIERHSHRGSASSASGMAGSTHDLSGSVNSNSRREVYGHSKHNHSQTTPRRQSLLSQAALGGSGSPHAEPEQVCVYDSSAYFIQDQEHRREVLMFGDVEPDSISLSPRNAMVWKEAGPKVANGMLRAVFLECSYDDSRGNDRLFGHLKPQYIIEELQVLAGEVEAARDTRSLESKKRKRVSDLPMTRRSVIKQSTPTEEPVSPKTFSPADDFPDDDFTQIPTPSHQLTYREIEPLSPPLMEKKHQLEGLKIIIIHIKDKLTDEEDAGSMILRELQELERQAQLGCEFIIAYQGQSVYL